MAEPVKRFQWTPLLTVFAIGISLIVVGWGFILWRRHQTADGVSHVARIPRTMSQSTNKQVSPAYAKALQEKEMRIASQAAKSGASYIPPPQESVSPNNTMNALDSLAGPGSGSSTGNTVSAAVPNTTNGASGNGTPGSFQYGGNAQNNPSQTADATAWQKTLAKRDKAGLSFLMTRLRVPPASTLVVAHKRGTAAGGNNSHKSAKHGLGGIGGARSTLPADLVRVLRPGAMLYAENDLALNSDSPGPVEATILSGPLTGARALGSMTKLGNYLTLKFTSITTRAGATYAISGYGVNPKIPATTVRSAVNRHLLSRWGGLLAASFLQGYGQAISQSGAQVASSYGSTVSTLPVLSPQQELLVAAGTVGQQLAAVAQTNFARPNTVTFDPGQPVAILILKG